MLLLTSKNLLLHISSVCLWLNGHFLVFIKVKGRRKRKSGAGDRPKPSEYALLHACTLRRQKGYGLPCGLPARKKCFPILTELQPDHQDDWLVLTCELTQPKAKVFATTIANCIHVSVYNMQCAAHYTVLTTCCPHGSNEKCSEYCCIL